MVESCQKKYIILKNVFTVWLLEQFYVGRISIIKSQCNTIEG